MRTDDVRSCDRDPTRRAVLARAAALLGLTSQQVGCDTPTPGPVGGGRSGVFIAKDQSYDRALEPAIRDGLTAVGLGPARVAGKRVLLKPNLVEPGHDRPFVTTHPAVVVAVAEVFRRWGAEVAVGEGAGHVRDTEAILSESRMDEPLAHARLVFHDLNYEETHRVENRGRVSQMAAFHLPGPVVAADFVVSIPKLKTHHWIGMTASMKNLYGVLPGSIYGWPKNFLHHMGIPQTVFDLWATLPETITVVDAIDCMEGDGPIMGDLKRMGLIVVGTDLPAVDATCAIAIGMIPTRIDYLQLAASRGFPVDEGRIDQRGEPVAAVASAFRIIGAPHLERLRAAPARG